jgi:beta-phosphoglucomutase
VESYPVSRLSSSPGSRFWHNAPMDAVVFDFDGVIVDSEPLHCAGFASAVRPLGVTLTWELYRERYLGFDDHDAFAAILGDHGIAAGEARVAELTRAKTVAVQEALAAAATAMPGAVDLIAALAAAGVPLAVCSGALRREIEVAARRIGVLDRFVTVVAAEDVRSGKPDPEGYALAVRRLGEAAGVRLRPERCVAVEDTPAGMAAARAAGLRVLAVATSYPAAELSAADAVAPTLASVTPATLAALVAGR